MVRLQPRGAVGDQRVADRVGLVEGVVLRRLHVLPELVRDRRRDVVRRAAVEELRLQRRHQLVDLLADRATQRLGLGAREAGHLLRDLQILFLIHANALGIGGNRLQPLVDVRDRLAPVLAGRVARDVLHRAGPVEGDERDQVLELGRLHLPQRVAHAGGLELEDARRVGARQHLVDLAVVERDRADVEIAADQLDGLVDHVEVAQAEEVHLQQAERLDVLHRDLRHDLLVGALLLQRHDLDQRLGADHDGGGVDRVGPGQALERLGEVDDLLRDRIVLDRVRELSPGLQGLRERLARAFRDHLRDPVDGAVRDLEHPPGVAHRCARRHRREGDDLRHAVAPVLLGDVVDHALPALDREVDVHVGHVLAGRVEEPLEQQAVAHRVDVGDAEAVGGERAGGAAAARPDGDAVPLGEADEVGDDQEVVGEAHLVHGLQLELEALGQLGRHPVVALRRARPRRARRGSRTSRGLPGSGTSAAGSGRARSRRCTGRRSRACGASRPRAPGSRAPSPPAS